MPVVRLQSEIDFVGWRTAARALRAQDVAPREVNWTAGQGDLSAPDIARLRRAAVVGVFCAS